MGDPASRPTWDQVISQGQGITPWPRDLQIEHREIGTLYLPSGRVVAADALVEPTLPPFALAVRPGRYPVRLAIAHLRKESDQRIAAAWLAFGAEPVTAWQPASLEPRAGKRATGPSAYGVDSGTGSFLSHEAAMLFAERLTEKYAETVMERMQSNYQPTRDWTMIDLPGAEGLNVAVFSSGYGDGAYASYWGLDSGGEPVVLLTDFDVLDPPEALRQEPGSTKPWWKFW